jgi:hypothetical protein
VARIFEYCKLIYLAPVNEYTPHFLIKSDNTIKVNNFVKLFILILNQTNLNLVTNNGDLVYDGEIIQYSITPTTSTTTTTAAQTQS